MKWTVWRVLNCLLEDWFRLYFSWSLLPVESNQAVSGLFLQILARFCGEEANFEQKTLPPPLSFALNINILNIQWYRYQHLTKSTNFKELGFLQTETFPADSPLKSNWIKKDYGGTSQTLHIHPRFHEVKQQKPFWGNFCCSQKWELIPWFLLRSTRGREKRSDFYKLLIANVESKNTKLLTCSH